MFYEVEKRKIQEGRKILAHSISTGKQERSPVCGNVRSDDAGLRVVGDAGPLKDDSKAVPSSCIDPVLVRIYLVVSTAQEPERVYPIFREIHLQAVYPSHATG